MPMVAELLDGHVTLTAESLDRLYLNGYAPMLQTGAQLVRFLEERRGGQCGSPALLEDEVIRENLDLGRPERVQLLFDRRVVATTAFLTKLDVRIFRPASAAMDPKDTVPRPLRTAFHRLDEALPEMVHNAHFTAA